MKELKHGPSPTAVAWRAMPNGKYYEHEMNPSTEVAQRRVDGVTVHAQTHYYAMQIASRELGLAPEHIDLQLKELTK